MNPYYQDEHCVIYHGDALMVLESLQAEVAAVLTDPPYSSGGLHRSDRVQKTGQKYTLSGTGKIYPEFHGDNRDQRSFAHWCAMWLGQCWRLAGDGAVLFVFSDWRQLPSVSDSLQAGGWIWRGIIPWDKTSGARPSKGWFRAQCEYIITGTRGSLGREQDREGGCYEGFWRQSVTGTEDMKEHATAKPVELHEFLLQAASGKRGVVLDPFMGSGTTLRAAKNSGLRAVGIEIEEKYCEIAAKRLAQEPLNFATR